MNNDRKRLGNRTLIEVVRIAGKEKFHEDILLTALYLQKASSSLDRDIDFELSYAEYKKLMRRKTCAYTNVPFDDSIPHMNRTLDRINPDKGYTVDNVVVCTKQCNEIKAMLFESYSMTPIEVTTLITMLESLVKLDFVPRTLKLQQQREREQAIKDELALKPKVSSKKQDMISKMSDHLGAKL